VKPASRTGDRVLYTLCAAAGLVSVAILIGVVIKVVNGASLSISHFGLSFLTHSRWAPNFGIFGAATALYGTLVSAFFALLLATPLGIAIGLYLAMMAPPGVRAVVGPLVEMLAAIPSVILGFWGFIIFAPFVATDIEPAVHHVLGFLPIFGSPPTTGSSIFTASLILTLMVLPIISSLSRDLFLTVPTELKEGAAALGATRWEVIRGIVLPTTVSGVAAATVLGLGRALGEAIAVSLVIGDSATIQRSLFEPGATLASRIAADFQFTVSELHVSSLFYLALILLIIGLCTSLLARGIASRFDAGRALAR
jgi:phosphate transport system permease protein